MVGSSRLCDSDSERILKVGQYLTKLCVDCSGLLFLAHPVEQRKRESDVELMRIPAAAAAAAVMVVTKIYKKHTKTFQQTFLSHHRSVLLSICRSMSSRLAGTFFPSVYTTVVSITSVGWADRSHRELLLKTWILILRHGRPVYLLQTQTL